MVLLPFFSHKTKQKYVNPDSMAGRSQVSLRVNANTTTLFVCDSSHNSFKIIICERVKFCALGFIWLVICVKYFRTIRILFWLKCTDTGNHFQKSLHMEIKGNCSLSMCHQVVYTVKFTFYLNNSKKFSMSTNQDRTL